MRPERGWKNHDGNMSKSQSITQSNTEGAQRDTEKDSSVELPTGLNDHEEKKKHVLCVALCEIV